MKKTLSWRKPLVLAGGLLVSIILSIGASFASTVKVHVEIINNVSENIILSAHASWKLHNKGRSYDIQDVTFGSTVVGIFKPMSEYIKEGKLIIYATTPDKSRVEVCKSSMRMTRKEHSYFTINDNPMKKNETCGLTCDVIGDGRLKATITVTGTLRAGCLQKN